MNFSEITSKLTPRGWLMVGGSAAGIMVFAYLLFSMASAPSYSTLMAGVDPAQTGKITTALSAQGIPYELQNNGTAIAVETDKVAQARVALATGGLLTSAGGSSTGLSGFNSSSSLGESNFQQNVAYQAALEQQLDSTIENIQGITSANVQLVLPDATNQLFSSSSGQATAAVLLNDSGSLDPGSVKGIAQLVASSVQGLTSQKVTITDQTGAPLWPTSASGADGALLSKQASESSYDAQMAAQVTAMLTRTLGPNKAEVQVDSDLDTNQTSSDSLTYAAKGVPLTEQTTNETLSGANATTTASATTIPAYASKGNGTNSKYINKTANTTFGVDKTVIHTATAPGQINRQTVSVLIDKSVPAAELPQLKAAVATAVGLNAKRGDILSFGQVQFAKSTVVPPAAAPGKMIGYAKYGVVGLGAVLFLFFMSRMLRKRENEGFVGQPTWLRELESPRSLASVEAEQLDAPRVMQLRPPVNVAKQQVEDLVERDPDRVASQVRQWMTED